jgi:DNA-3-methyladenine glycosylase
MEKLNAAFYLRKDVVKISIELLGKVLFTKVNGIITGGIITETEAYAGAIDRASHAYNNRKTNRTKVMFRNGGIAYVYLCYGIHHLFNVVTGPENVPHAVLIRAVKPIQGIDEILKRRSQVSIKSNTAGGPGTVSQALGINTFHTGISLLENVIWIEDHGIKIKRNDIVTGPRVGLGYAGQDAFLPYRFRILI